MVSDKDFGQIFITDTSRDRIESVFKEINVEVMVFDIDKGVVAGSCKF